MPYLLVTEFTGTIKKKENIKVIADQTTFMIHKEILEKRNTKVKLNKPVLISRHRSLSFKSYDMRCNLGLRYLLWNYNATTRKTMSFHAQSNFPSDSTAHDIIAILNWENK